MTVPAWPPEATCGRCKWWANDVSWVLNAPHAGTCDRVLLDIGATPTKRKSPMVGWAIHFTHCDHGCRAWEPKAA